MDQLASRGPWKCMLADCNKQIATTDCDDHPTKLHADKKIRNKAISFFLSAIDLNQEEISAPAPTNSQEQEQLVLYRIEINLAYIS